jgi:hypothetical protein
LSSDSIPPSTELFSAANRSVELSSDSIPPSTELFSAANRSVELSSQSSSQSSTPSTNAGHSQLSAFSGQLSAFSGEQSPQQPEVSLVPNVPASVAVAQLEAEVSDRDDDDNTPFSLPQDQDQEPRSSTAAPVSLPAVESFCAVIEPIRSSDVAVNHKMDFACAAIDCDEEDRDEEIDDNSCSGPKVTPASDPQSVEEAKKCLTVAQKVFEVVSDQVSPVAQLQTSGLLLPLSERNQDCERDEEERNQDCERDEEERNQDCERDEERNQDCERDEEFNQVCDRDEE